MASAGLYKKWIQIKTVIDREILCLPSQTAQPKKKANETVKKIAHSHPLIWAKAKKSLHNPGRLPSPAKKYRTYTNCFTSNKVIFP